MKAVKYIAKRLGEFVISITVLSFVIFSLLYLAPGDPASVLIGVRKPNPEVLNAIREQYHLNDPFFTQFVYWLRDAVHLDFGNSIRTGQPVVSTIAPHLAVTIQLVAFALILSLVIGLIFGVISAKRRNRLPDKTINLFALVGTSAPSFAVGLLLLYVLAYSLRLFPLYGIGDGSFGDTVKYLALPAITLTVGVSAMLIKITRSSMLGEVMRDYGMFMRARAVRPLRITLAQLRNASGPILTSTGLVLASLLGSTVLIETTFAIPGVGNLLASSVVMKDVPVVQFLTLVLAVFICLSSAIVDICVYFADPQARVRGTRGLSSEHTNSSDSDKESGARR